MHIISRKRLLQASMRHRGSAVSLDAWYRTANSAKWKSIQEVRQTYSHADGVSAGSKVYTVFNVGGNNLRLITGINYKTQRVFIKHVLTHAEYSKGAWKR